MFDVVLVALTLYLVHGNHVFGVNIDTQRYELVFKVINGVEVLQKETTKQEVAVVKVVERVLCDCKLAYSIALVQVGHWLQFKNCFLNHKGY